MQQKNEDAAARKKQQSILIHYHVSCGKMLCGDARFTCTETHRQCMYLFTLISWWRHGMRHLRDTQKLQVAHAPGMPGKFSPPPQVSDSRHASRHVRNARVWMHAGSLTSGFLWNRWWGKRYQYSRCMRNQQFYVSGKRPMDTFSAPLPGVIYHVYLPILTR